MRKTVFILFLSLLTVSPTFSQKNFKVIAYNIWNGFDWGKDMVRRTKCINWISKQNPNVVALEELCGYTPEKLKEDAKKWGHDYSVLLKTSGYPVGLTSKYPIKIKERILEGLGHGALHCETMGIDFLVVHLNPASALKRRMEAKILLKKLEAIKSENENYVVLGDFNAHSPFDAHLYCENGSLLMKYRKNNADSVEGNLVNNSFDYAVISSFLSTGMEDVVQKFSSGMEEKGSYPTRVFEDVQELKKEKQSVDNIERIDYVFVSPKLGASCTGAKISNGSENFFLSDHYPVVASFNLEH